MTFDCIGIARHRMGSDGEGVTTLVGGYGCPLDCRYCLNPQCKSERIPLTLTIDELYERIRIDSLYFEASGGGVTFGGGEPLLQAKFIREFILFIKKKGNNWRFSIETSLSCAKQSLEMLDGLIDEYIVDIKDMNDRIYRDYTGCSSSAMKQGLEHLLKYADSVIVKTPLIPEYNTAEDTLRSHITLSEMGYKKIVRLRYITNINKK